MLPMPRSGASALQALSAADLQIEENVRCVRPTMGSCGVSGPISTTIVASESVPHYQFSQVAASISEADSLFARRRIWHVMADRAGNR